MKSASLDVRQFVLTRVVAALAACLLLFTSRTGDAADSNKRAVKYPTKAELLAATKSGEIIESINEKFDVIGDSVVAILKDEYQVRLDFPLPSVPVGILFKYTTKYELGARQDARLAETCASSRRDVLASGYGSAALTNALKSLSEEYVKAVREYAARKQKEQDKQEVEQAAETLRQKRADIAAQQEQDKRDRAKAEGKAQLARQIEEEEMRAKLAKEALDAEAKAREQKRMEIMATPAYRLWKSAVGVEEGLKMVRSGRDILEHDNQVAKESGVTDLAKRKHGGELIVAGKRAVDRAFAEYQRLGGAALTPEDVHAGPNPANLADDYGAEIKAEMKSSK